MKKLLFVLLIFCSWTNISWSQSGSDEDPNWKPPVTYQIVVNVEVKESTDPDSGEPQTRVEVLGGSVTNLNTGESEAIDRDIFYASGPDQEKNKEKAVGKSKETIWKKIFNFITGKGKDDKKVMAGPDGQGDLRNGGEIIFTLGIGPPAKGEKFAKFHYKNTDHLTQSFSRDFSSAVMKMPASGK